jgi:hypothetical protein
MPLKIGMYVAEFVFLSVLLRLPSFRFSFLHIHPSSPLFHLFLSFHYFHSHLLIPSFYLRYLHVSTSPHSTFTFSCPLNHSLLYLFSLPSIFVPSLNKYVCLHFPCGCMVYLWASLNCTDTHTHMNRAAGGAVFTLLVYVVSYGIHHWCVSFTAGNVMRLKGEMFVIETNVFKLTVGMILAFTLRGFFTVWNIQRRLQNEQSVNN